MSDKILKPVVLSVLCLMLVFSGCSGQDEPAAPRPVDATPSDQGAAVQGASVPGTIVAMGNSLTEGYQVDESRAYPALLEKKLAEAGYRFRVINAGISGETSSGALSRINWVLTLKPDIVILETGANDGLRGVDPDMTAQNINRIVDILKQNQVTVILAGMKMMSNLGGAYTQAFARTYQNVAEKHDLVFMPFFLEGVAGDSALNQSDVIHPTAAGYRIITDNIYPYVVTAIKSLPKNKTQ